MPVKSATQKKKTNSRGTIAPSSKRKINGAVRSGPREPAGDILSVLHEEHETVATMLDEALDCAPGDDRMNELAADIERALTVHAAVEEQVFYSPLRDRAEEGEQRIDVFEGFTEHEVVKRLIALLKDRDAEPDKFTAELQTLCEAVTHHVKEEESTIFKLAKKLFDRNELDRLGADFQAGKEAMLARA